MSIKRIQRPELFFGLVGPVGVDLDMIVEVLKTELDLFKYESEVVRITELMTVIPSKKTIDESNYLDRIKSRIDYADDVCSQLKEKMRSRP